MRMRILCILTWPAIMLGLTATQVLADQANGNDQDRTAINKNGEAFVEAFHKGDAKAVAAFWTEDGDYTDQTGRHLKGRQAIERAFEKFFSENKDMKAHIRSQSLRFLTPEVAIEDGTSEVYSAEGSPPSRARFTIVHVKKDGQWLLSNVRDAAMSPPSNYNNLRGLEWAIGEWVGEGGDGKVERLSLAWTADENFIVANMATFVKDVSVGSATQWIAWDPETKRVRSWIFDATGDFGEGAWSKEDSKWVIKTTSVLHTGKKGTATYIIARVDADTMTFQSRDRTEDGKSLPDSKEVTMKRDK
jgi:uncharacterized protein (TIGR02246 family)